MPCTRLVFFLFFQKSKNLLTDIKERKKERDEKGRVRNEKRMNEKKKDKKGRVRKRKKVMKRESQKRKEKKERK